LYEIFLKLFKRLQEVPMEDYVITEETYKEIISLLNKALQTKVVYNVDKLAMAEACIEKMRINIKLTKNAISRIKGDCCGPE